MRTHPYTFESWPRTKAGVFILTSTEDAVYFAHLVSHRIEIINKINSQRKVAYQEIAKERAKPHPNGNRMMDLAFKAQFARECLEEIKRINDLQYEL